MSLADRIRGVIEEFYESGTPEGRALQAIVDDIPAANRALLVAFLERLERTCALSCPASDLAAAVDDTLEDQR